jgi:hypothetical protein
VVRLGFGVEFGVGEGKGGKGRTVRRRMRFATWRREGR